ncbi:hypothetical protein [Klebsiella quasivariicola]|uniref:Uncharacterized protein n=1 Tax=Klebsiella quasivariicola TaxID=2026240 RepID=A0A8B4TQF8_9ENTR|nr:hypothetical protein [Klebsiella quasivariicola]SXD86823.1 Uncharacterised protein [Klebsiella quasivariicola]
MFRTRQTNKLAKKELITKIDNIAKMWDLNKKDLAFISGIKYKTIARSWNDETHSSVATLEGILSSLKTFIPDNLDKFSDLDITEDMLALLK